MTRPVRRWLAGALGAAGLVADRAALWLPGALAWLLTVGWIPMVVVVARPPTVADLTFLGGRLASAGLWPWNVVLILSAGLLAVACATALVALAEAALSAMTGRPVRARAALRIVGIGFVTAAPALFAIMAFAIGFALIAPREFTSPAAGDPLLRTLGRLVPFGVGVALAWIGGTLLHAGASRAVLLRGDGAIDALRRSPRMLAGGGVGTLLQLAAVVALRIGYLAFAVLLLGVLWAPIGSRLATEGPDAAHLALLVGFTAIWLCLVLGGGALHAWGTVSWTRTLGGPRPHGDAYRP